MESLPWIVYLVAFVIGMAIAYWVIKEAVCDGYLQAMKRLDRANAKAAKAE